MEPPGLEIGLPHDNARTEVVSPNLLRSYYEMVENSGLEGDLPYDTVKRTIMWDSSTGMVANISVQVGFSAAAIPIELSAAVVSEEDWEHPNLNFYLFPADSGTGPGPILVDLPEPEPEGASDDELGRYREVVEQLRSRGRQLVAEELVELLHSIQEDPDDDVEIQLYSLQSMARFLIQHNEFDDPLATPDPDGLMQIEWSIFGDGLLVMAFLEDDNVHCVAQADLPTSNEALNISAELPMEQVAEEYGYLVPQR